MLVILLAMQLSISRYTAAIYNHLTCATVMSLTVLWQVQQWCDMCCSFVTGPTTMWHLVQCLTGPTIMWRLVQCCDRSYNHVACLTALGQSDGWHEVTLSNDTKTTGFSQLFETLVLTCFGCFDIINLWHGRVDVPLWKRRCRLLFSLFLVVPSTHGWLLNQVCRTAGVEETY